MGEAAKKAALEKIRLARLNKLLLAAHKKGTHWEMKSKDEARRLHNLKSGPAAKRLTMEMARMKKAVVITRLALRKMKAVRKKLGLKKFRRTPAMEKAFNHAKERAKKAGYQIKQLQ